MQSTKYRIWPTRKQERKLLRYLHASRYAFNLFVDYQEFFFTAAKAELIDWSQAFFSKFDACKLDPAIRKQVHWINRSVPVEIVRDGLKRAAAAFKGKWQHNRGWPNHKKYADAQSFSYSSAKIYSRGSRTYIKVPGKLDIEIQLHKDLPSGKIKRVTISRDVDQWYAAVTYVTAVPKPYTSETVMALDDGITSVLALSTGEKIAPPKPLKAAKQRLKRLQRSLSKSQKGSNRYKRKRHKLAKAHQKVRRKREYFGKYLAHRITELASSQRTILLWQDTHIAGMMKNHRLAGAFGDVAVGQIKVWLAQQCEKKGIPHELFPRFEKTTGMCPLCGNRHELKLSDREFICCGIRHDRDVAVPQYMEKIWLENNRTLVGSTRAGRGMDCIHQLRGLGSDRRLGLRPLVTRDVAKLSEEPSKGPPMLYRPPDVALATVGIE